MTGQLSARMGTAIRHAGHRLKRHRAATLADQFPLDFSVLIASLREGAELRWVKAASAKAG